MSDEVCPSRTSRARLPASRANNARIEPHERGIDWHLITADALHAICSTSVPTHHSHFTTALLVSARGRAASIRAAFGGPLAPRHRRNSQPQRSQGSTPTYGVCAWSKKLSRYSPCSPFFLT